MIDLKDRFGRFFNIQARAEKEAGFTLVAPSKLSPREKELAAKCCDDYGVSYQGKLYKFYRFEEVAAATMADAAKIAAIMALFPADSGFPLVPGRQKTSTVSLTLVVGSGAQEIVEQITAAIPAEVLEDAIGKASAYLESAKGVAKLRVNGTLEFSLVANIKVMTAATKIEITREY